MLKSKAETHYRLVDTPGESCHTCLYRIDNGDQPSTCQLVVGTVDPQHVCDLFAPMENRMTDTLELTFEEYEADFRAKYKADDLKDMVGKGQAMKNANGDASYPVGDVADLKKAIMAVGRGGADHDAIRAHIIKNAKRLGAANLIPDNWNADGSLKQSNDAEEPAVEHKSRRKPRHRSMPLLPEYRRGEGIQVRRFDLAESGLEVRESANGSLLEISGSPIRYNTPYTVRDMAGEFSETMKPGVASQLLSSGDLDCRFLFNHEGLPLARTTAGTLDLRDSPSGLMMTAHLDARQHLAQDLAIAIERGDVSQMSCGFIVASDTWTDDSGNPTSPASGTQRSIHRFDDLLDVSAVTYPASPTTSIDVAARMLLEQPVESRARMRSLWAFAKDLRDGQTVSAEDRAALVDGLEALATAEELTVEERANVCRTCGGFGTCPDCTSGVADGLAGPQGDQNAPVSSGAMGGDGTGSRDEEPEAEKRTDAPKIQMQLELMRMRRLQLP